jgi:hypothetical protein
VRDEALVEGLLFRFRLLTPALAACLWGTSAAYAGRRLTLLHARGWVDATRVLARPVLDLTAPVATWRPGEQAPDFGAISYRLRARWSEPPRLATVYLPTKKAARLFGGPGGRFDYPLQATHDLHVAALFVRLNAEDPEAASRWRGEEWIRLGRKKGKVCDAWIVGAREKPVLAVEFGGSYRADRVAAFHRGMDLRHLPYQIW